MATANDSVYVKFIADTSDFMSKVKQTLTPIQQFTKVVRSIMTMGGAAIILRQIAQQVGEMEKAFVKLHPESQTSVGSLNSWTTAITNMKAEAGGIVSSILTPLREAFLKIIDPVHSATWEVNQLQAALQAIADKYLTEERKQYESREELLEKLNFAQSQLTIAVNTHGYYLERLRIAQKEYDADVSESLRTQRPQQLELRKALDAAKLAYEENVETITKARIAVRNAEETLRKLNIQTGTTTETIVTLTEAIANETSTWDYGTEAYKRRREEMEKLAKAYDDMYNAAEPSGKTGGGAKTRTRPGRKGSSDITLGDDFSNWLQNYEKQIEEAEKSNEKLEESTEDIRNLWRDIGYEIVRAGEAMGAAFATGDVIGGLKQIAQQIISLLVPLAIEAAASAAIAQNWPMVALWLGIAGIAGFTSGAIGSAGNANREGVELPRMAQGGMVTRPTLALIGESGPEAVVPLGRGAGGTTIIVQGSIWQTEDLARAVAGAMGRW